MKLFENFKTDLAKAGESNFKALGLKERTYKEKVFNSLLDIILNINNVSEKNFNGYDVYEKKLNYFLIKNNFNNFAEFYNKNEYRIEYAAEDYFHKYKEYLKKL